MLRTLFITGDFFMNKTDHSKKQATRNRYAAKKEDLNLPDSGANN